MNVYLQESDSITKFEIELGVLTICYGKTGKISGVVCAYDLSDKQPCTLNLMGANFSVNVFFKSLKMQFETHEKLIAYLDANIELHQSSTTNMKEIMVGTPSDLTENDIKDMFAELKRTSEQDIKF